ncbi:uncharacterized protein N7483_009101 [Penicillium malachiteum]|uniref:uncharacterized protein n=1 Tax=Penicillium malachiteum TaxID=1324776 RepID=UPI002548F7ED|nr:uncharacterized protein N7483_009101 [Penicillium malachiteum]KAJ5721167.1 hypothetical protein N7483_009101 [Penicillium malachiteum]
MARKYGGVSELGKKIKEWLETADGACPIAPCTVVVNDQYSIDDKADVPAKFRDDLYAGPVAKGKQGDDTTSEDSNDSDYKPPPARAAAAAPEEEEEVVRVNVDEGVIGPPGEGPFKKAWTHVDRMAQLFSDVDGLDLPGEKDANGEWIEFYSANKYDPVEHLFPANERDARMKAYKKQWAGGVIPDDKKQVQAWYGILTKGVIIIEYMARNHDEPPISEVTNALYSDLVPEDGLKYVFVHDIQNVHTRDFISKMLFAAHNGHKWPPGGVGNESLWRYDSNTEEYEGLMGTNIGRMVGYWLLGRYPRGTCTIPTIYIALSGVDTPQKKLIDLLFGVRPTAPAHELPKDGAVVVEGLAPGALKVAGPALKAGIPLPGIKPAFEPVPPLGGKPLAAAIAAIPPAFGPVPPPGEKPFEAAIAAVPPTAQEIRKRNQRDREEQQEADVEARFGKLRSGKQRKFI